LRFALAQNKLTRYIRAMDKCDRIATFESTMAMIMGMPMLMPSPAGRYVRED
jgi:hypothetical protein